MPQRSRPLAERFWSRVDASGGLDACWPWMGARNPRGYGKIKSGPDRAELRASRVAWALANGPIPDGLVICHHCDNPPCVNPAHLFLGTLSDNTRDMWAKGRAAAQRGLGRWAQKA